MIIALVSTYCALYMHTYIDVCFSAHYTHTLMLSAAPGLPGRATAQLQEAATRVGRVPTAPVYLP